MAATFVSSGARESSVNHECTAITLDGGGSIMPDTQVCHHVRPLALIAYHCEEEMKLPITISSSGSDDALSATSIRRDEYGAGNSFT